MVLGESSVVRQTGLMSEELSQGECFSGNRLIQGEQAAFAETQGGWIAKTDLVKLHQGTGARIPLTLTLPASSI